MQYLQITPTTKLPDLAARVGQRNVSNVLAVNGLSRCYDIGKQYTDLCHSIISSASEVNWEKKAATLNTFTKDSDIFEAAALATEADWKLLSSLNSFVGMIQLPESVTIPQSADMLGNGEGVSTLIYRRVMDSLKTTQRVDPAIFNKYSTIKDSKLYDASGTPNLFQWFHIPWGEITVHSSIDDMTMDIPVYPEELTDKVQANYTQMPDLLYQYEPWQIFNSSGPVNPQPTFKIHRDMWTGDHRDGKANELVRFLQAQCYPEYDGSAVYSAITTIYIHGRPYVSGILNDVVVNWSGPIGLDGWYLVMEITLSFTEVSQKPLSYSVIKNKPIIG